MLTFEGVDSCFYLFVNGKFASYSQVSHMTSEFKVTNHLHTGEKNISFEFDFSTEFTGNINPFNKHTKM